MTEVRWIELIATGSRRVGRRSPRVRPPGAIAGMLACVAPRLVAGRVAETVRSCWQRHGGEQQMR